MVVIRLLIIALSPAFAAAEAAADCQADETAASLPHDTIKILSLNIAHGRNTAVNQLLVSEKRTYQNLDNIAALLEGTAPDIVALQEADGPSRWSGNFNHVAYLSEQTSYPCVVHGLHSSSWISSYGTALLSRVKPSTSSSIRFSQSWPSKRKGFVIASFNWHVEPLHVPITFVSVHFDFTRKSVRDQQVREMVEHLSNMDGLLVLMGDLNSQWDEEESHVRMLADDLNLRAFSPEDEGLGTFKKADGKRLDWILISPELEYRDYRVLPNVVADHFSVFAEIAYSGLATN